MKLWLSAAYRWLLDNAFWLWQVGALVVAIFFTFAVIRPFDDGEDSVSKLEDVAGSWNASISKLGISPIFPPQESFYVGDLWAIVSDAPAPSYLGKGARVAHIDLSDAIRAEQKNRINLESIIASGQPAAITGQSAATAGQPAATTGQTAATAGQPAAATGQPAATAGQPAAATGQPATTAGQPDLSKNTQARFTILAFPGVSISRTEDNRAASALAYFGFSASRKVQVSDELKIPMAYSYGAETVDALLRFYEFCDNQKTRVRCTEQFARSVLATTLDEKIAPTSAEAGKFKIRLQLVTRVYLTNKILHKKGYIGDTTFVGSADVSPSSGNSPEGSKRQLSHQGGNSSDMSFDEKFERPLVFGFRSSIFIPAKE
jgi:hypothetical protein